MACARCQQWWPKKTPYCDNCEAIVNEENNKLARYRMSDEEWKSEFAQKARDLITEAEKKFNQNSTDESILDIVHRAMIYASEDSSVYARAKEVYTAIKQNIADRDEFTRRETAELREKEKAKAESNMKNIHIGLIDTKRLFVKDGALRSHTFITLVDGYNKMIFWNKDKSEDYYDKDLYDVKNDNWDNEHESETRIRKEVFFKINNDIDNRIITAFEKARSENIPSQCGICVVFRMESTPRGINAIDVMLIEDALSNPNMLESIKRMITNDINVYFFLMDHVPEFYETYFSGVAFNTAWDYKELADYVEITGTTLKAKNDYEYNRDSRIYHYPSDTVIFPDYICGKPVKHIAPSSFSNDQRVKKYVIPDTVVEIGERAFEKNEGLEEVILPKGLTSINAYTFAECSSLKTINLTQDLQEIGESAFAGCRSLKNLWLPDQINEIGERAFENCQRLRKLIIPSNVRTIKGHTFADCSSLKYVELPEKLTAICENAFSNSGLVEISIPFSVTSVSESAFTNCNAIIKRRLK